MRYKCYFESNSTNLKEYSHRLIEKVLSPVVDFLPGPAGADLVLVSICDVTEIGDIVKARRYGRPILTGGGISEFPIVNEMSDYVWHGEVYGLRDHLATGDVLETSLSISTRQNRRFVLDETIRWHENPIVCVGGRAAYYYAAKGCPMRCKYCLMGNTRTYQKCPEWLYRRAEQQIVASKKSMFPIAAYNPWAPQSKRSITEIMLRKYASGAYCGDSATIRSGVEFVTPALSTNLAKGVTLDHVNEALDRSKRDKDKLILYFIGGLESTAEWENWLGGLRVDYATTPAVQFVLTYLEPQAGTPFFDYDLRGRFDLDHGRLLAVARQVNKRVRFQRPAQMKHSTSRALQSRTLSPRLWDEYRRAEARMTNEQLMTFAEKVEPGILGSASLADVMARPRVGNYGTVFPYWQAVGVT